MYEIEFHKSFMEFHKCMTFMEFHKLFMEFLLSIYQLWNSINDYFRTLRLAILLSMNGLI